MSAIIKTLKTKTDNTEQSVYPKTVLEAVVDSETNETLDNIVSGLNDKIDEIPRENLLKYPFQDTTISRDGITFTDNLDGTITVNGTNTSTSTVDYSLALRAGAVGVTAKNPTILPAGTYTLSGCPEGGSDSTYYLRTGTDDANLNYKDFGKDYGQGITFTTDDESQMGVVIYIAAGATVNNLTFKPMLEVGTEVHDYHPYALSRKGLVSKTEVVDNLLSTATDLPLSAKQGKVLNESLEGLLDHFYAYSSIAGGTKHTLTDELPTGLFFFIVTDSQDVTHRATPSFGIWFFDNPNKLGWVNFQKSSDSTITGVTYSSSEGLVITTSLARYVTIRLLNLENINPTKLLTT